jgi:hypothetical protein
MRIRTIFRLALASALVVSAGAAPGRAQSVDKRTFFEFSGPVAVPGVTLPAGKYMFRVTAATQRDVLQVLSADGVSTYAQFFALRAYRAESVPTPEIRFMETGPGVPAAVKTWWYPSDLVGYEFIYPKAQARLLATGTGQPVLTTRGEVVMEPPLDLTYLGPAGEERAATEAEPFMPALPAATGEVPAEEIPAEAYQEAAAVLPRTATITPVITLFGVGLLLGAGLLAMARARRR